MSTEEFLAANYPIILEGAELPDMLKDHLMYKPLETLDELETAYSELLYAIKNKEKYTLLQRIERIEVALDKETDKEKRTLFLDRLKLLTERLEQIAA